jgi:hypothetical protein
MQEGLTPGSSFALYNFEGPDGYGIQVGSTVSAKTLKSAGFNSCVVTNAIGEARADSANLNRLVRLPVGETIQRGDKFLSDDGRYLEMDNFGRLLGMRCLGQVLKKEGAWFREPNTSIIPMELKP